MSDPVMQKGSSQDGNISSFVASDSKNHSQRSLIVYTIVAIGLALFIRFFIAAPYIVQGSSMEPTFDNFHYLIIDRVSYRLGEPQRGDVIVLDLPQDTSRALIKRVIGLPGDTVIIKNNEVTIKNTAQPDGFTLNEPYVAAQNLGGVDDLTVTLGPDQYFVLGDNRRVSADSRIWGTLPREDIEGKVFLRLYPFTQIGFLPGEARYQPN
ncbi:MAG: signal peptidase I [Candidatus Kaiserbacteria bacterium]|nr:signal peptidase I [Candidatus Kaiserbacteria bacterium]